MQPCTTCGSTTVNPIGYCTGCGTFRGAETAPPGHPQHYEQGYEQSYDQPQSYEQYQQPPYGGEQYAQPQYQQPAYGQPGSPPQQPYPQPQIPPQQFAPQQVAPQQLAPARFAPAPQPRRSGSGLVVGIVVGVLILLIGGGAAVALVVTNGEDPKPPADPTRSTPAAASSGPADPCVVGVWVEKQSNYIFQFEGVSVNMSASGATQRFRPDGTGDLDMTAGIVATGTAGGKRYERTTNGKVTFKYHPQGSRIYYTDVVGSGSSTVKVDGVTKGTPVPVTGSLDPDTYTCSGGTFVQSGDGYRIELAKQ